jgi:SNF2 family DNA or RNA helicase/uncharacterized Zn finger protein
MKKYGQTWWGQNWLNALAHIDWENRLPRGRSYANVGAVKSIKIERNNINAAVQGRRRTPYKVVINVPPFTNKQKKCLIEEITNNTLILTQLLNRELPVDLYNIAQSKGIQIFPLSWNDFDMHCSCPDWAVPCKHLAAVIYIIANEIDRNPFIVFELHDFSLVDILENQNISLESKSKEKIQTVADLTIDQKSDEINFQYDEKILDTLDISIIDNIKENLLELLSSSPLFYEKDFKQILNSAYKNIARSTSQFLINKSPISDSPVEITQSQKVTIECDENFQAKNCYFYNDDKKSRCDLDSFIKILRGIELKNIANLYPPIIALTNILHFALKLLEKSAFIPQLICIKKDRYKIRWIPALIDENVEVIFKQLLTITPPDMINFRFKASTGKKVKLKTQTPKEQLISLTALFIENLLQHFTILKDIASQVAIKNNSNKILSLFFTNNTITFYKFSEKELPNTIQLWLNKFFISHKDYIPIIKVEENNNHFVIDLMIENSKQQFAEPIPLNQFLTHKQYEHATFDVLKDLALLSEHFEQLKEVIHTNGKKQLVFNSTEFTEILLKILPVIKLFGISILLPKALQNLIKPQISLKMQKKDSGNIGSYLDLQQMLSFEWQIALGNELIDVNDFKKLVKQLSGIVKIKDQFVLIDQNEIEKLFNNLTKPPQLSANELLRTALTEEYNSAKIQLDKNVRELLNSIIKIDKVDLPENLQATLRPYQITGYEWMVRNAKLGFGSLIADDMGLGKTLQVIAVLLKFKQDGYFIKNKTLIIVPTTLLTNWQNEIKKFAPRLKSFIYHGLNRELHIHNYDCIITTYGIIRSDIEKFQHIKWHTVVIDEAQNIKNPTISQTKAIKKLKFDVRIAMSGTPVENRLSEYWSILDFTNKGYLGSLSKFTEEFARPIQLYRNHEKIDTFRKITAPFILRRLKSDKNIIKDLPDKVENNQYCSLTKEQAALYQNVVNNIMSEIENQEGIARKGLVLKLMTALKQICNHPIHFLKKGKLEAELSGKTTLLFNILENIYENNEKTLIFTQYKEMGDLLLKLIEQKFSATPLFLHGGTVRKNRDKMVTDFQQKKHIKTFILSLKAGGTGLNLTAAQNVIHYDLWWNPAVEAQATDRTYRIGQTERVMVYRLLTKNTFEEKIDNMLNDKKELANLTVSVGEKWIGELSNDELKNLVELRN